MQLSQGIHLGYCTNIHRGGTWEETFAALQQHTLRVREAVAPEVPYGVGLRLGHEAAQALAGSEVERSRFRRWLDEHNSYVYTINGFPYGVFHGARVKEQVYVPDWTTHERLDYTVQLFELLDEFAPPGMEASVSTLPGSFKEFITDRETQEAEMIERLLTCADRIAQIGARSGRDLHLGLEPEPLGYFETTEETVAFFERLFEAAPDADLVRRCIGVNYDTCHLAVEYEAPEAALQRLVDAGIRLSKVHLSSALKLQPEAAALSRLADFQEDTYLHQVVAWRDGTVRARYRDLPDALADQEAAGDEEWRVHFHIPIHAHPDPPFGDTRDHLEGTLRFCADHPDHCHHFEMETYTWEVMPASLRAGEVVDQLVREYEWCLKAFGDVGIGPAPIQLSEGIAGGEPHES